MNDQLLNRLQASLRPGLSRRQMAAAVFASVFGGRETLSHREPVEAKRRKKRRRRKNKDNRGLTCQPDESLCEGEHCCAPGQQCLGATFGCVNGALQPGEVCDPAVPLACASGECGCNGTDCFCRYDTCAPLGVSCFVDLECCTGFCFAASYCREMVPM